MPWLDIVARSSWCSLWYITNGFNGLTSSFDPAKPTVLLLHPVFLDTTWLRGQLDDARLSEGYNLVAFDARCHGRTQSTASGKHDIWVEMADVAFFCHRLRLPPVHVFAAEGVATYAALRFAAIFPEMVLSLTLCQVPPPEQMSWVRKLHEDLCERWTNVNDLSSLEDVGMDYVESFIGDGPGGDGADTDLRDEINAFFQRYWPPITQARLQEEMNVVYTRTHMERVVLEAITVPTLIIQGQWSKVNPLEFAQEITRNLVNVEGGARLYTIRDSKGSITVVPKTTGIVTETFCKFLGTLPHSRSDDLLPYEPLDQRMKRALQRLSEITGNAECAKRDPFCPLSFSQLTPSHIEENNQRVAYYARRQATAFSPLGPDGWPLRAYSQRPAERRIAIDVPKKPSKPAPQPSIFGLIPIGPAFGRLGNKRTSDQDLSNKLAKAHGSTNGTNGRPSSSEVSGKLQRGRRGTVVPDDAKYSKSSKKQTTSRF